MRRDQGTAIAWIRSHIGISGSVKADRRAAYESILGVVSGSPRVATEEGIRTISKATRREERVAKGMGLRRMDWTRGAISAYTWLRTNRAPRRPGFTT